MSEVLSFDPSFPPALVQRLQERLRDVRPPTEDVVADAGSAYGMPTSWAQKLYKHWTEGFSWPDAALRIQRWEHFTTRIEDLQVHFVHEKSARKDAVPLLMIHGWPGSFYEFSEIIGPLTKGSESKGREQLFHVVAPSLPGFCWSSSPQQQGWTTKDTARVFHRLMERLGYSRYAVQAGDWGQFVARELGAQYADSCRVMHLNYCPGALPENGDEAAPLTEREIACRAKGEEWRTKHVGYAVLMRTRPQTLGWMLIDQPLALMSFVGEKYEEAASPSVSSTAQWLDHVCTTVALYYFTRCIATSALVYFENPRHDQFAEFAMREENLIRCPFGYTSMWYDTAPSSERAVRRTGNLVWYNERDYAGHFACLEDPIGLSQDIRAVVTLHWT